MNVAYFFDSGVTQLCEIHDREITFDLRPEQRIINVLVSDAPAGLKVHLSVDEKGAKFLVGQGLLISKDGLLFAPVPLEWTGEGMLTATLPVEGGNVRIATRYPYGRDHLDRLMCDTYHTPHARVRLLHDQYRIVPMFDFGQDDGSKWHHFFNGGEDCWETAGCWVADEMVRILCFDQPFAEKLLKQHVLHIVPLVSPYSSTTASPSYTTLDGRSIYGAATYGDPLPPPEYALIRQEITAQIKRKKLGLLLTIHSWQAQSEYTGLETIRTSGDNALSGARYDWAAETLATLIRELPHGRTAFPEKIWHPGLARDYLLREFNAVTFRVEITTRGQGYEGFRLTARKFLENLAAVEDWSPVCSS